MDFDVNGVNELAGTSTSPAVNNLASLLLRKKTASEGAPLLDGKVVSYDTSTCLAVVTVRGVAVPDIPNVSGLFLATNDVVTLANYGPSYIVLGSLTATARQDIPITSLALAAGWGGSVTYERRSGIATVITKATQAAYAANSAITSAPLPAGARPSDVLALGGLNSSGDNSFRSWAITATGVIQSAAAGTTSIWGSTSYVGH